MELGAGVAMKSSHKLYFCLKVKPRNRQAFGGYSQVLQNGGWPNTTGYRNLKKCTESTSQHSVRFFPTTLPSSGHCCFASFLIQHFVKKTSLKEWDVESSFPSLGKMTRCGIRMYAQSGQMPKLLLQTYIFFM